MNATMLRRYGAELVGTFAYVFLGCGVKIVRGSGQRGVNGFLIYLTFGLALVVLFAENEREKIQAMYGRIA
jgi:glycerol uptake facilitator-like aquaporin